MIKVVLPAPLCTLAGVSRQIEVTPSGPPTLCSLLDAVEADYPVLRGTIRDPNTGKRRPFVRYFAAERDLSHEEADLLLPSEVTEGDEPFIILGSISGGWSAGGAKSVRQLMLGLAT